VGDASFSVDVVERARRENEGFRQQEPRLRVRCDAANEERETKQELTQITILRQLMLFHNIFSNNKIYVLLDIS